MIKKDSVNKKFGLITGAMLLLIFGYQLLIRHHQTTTLGVIGGLLIVLALAIPRLLNPLRIVWDKIGAVMGAVNTVLILLLVYVFIIVPMGLIMRLLRQNLLNLEWKSPRETYFDTTATTSESSYKQQF
ncbi:SxtJ family membrane protein [Mucilaginibacter agri]|uniref:SxtJ n=1 Tax=Mucilaginibacter agri TaxID=2695265 RepID=A0A965ZCC5_9SPHI|nr:SxtJ family membrane protein [Mucilaginibacter agri]NCD68145.1 hypothetical protein [Mucilaginibacter agri]